MSDWFEIWADFGQRPPYVLVVQAEGDDIRVFDPQEGQRRIFGAHDYATVFTWLREDEFELVQGRVVADQ